MLPSQRSVFKSTRFCWDTGILIYENIENVPRQAVFCCSLIIQPKENTKEHPKHPRNFIFLLLVFFLIIVHRYARLKLLNYLNLANSLQWERISEYIEFSCATFFTILRHGDIFIICTIKKLQHYKKRKKSKIYRI